MATNDAAWITAPLQHPFTVKRAPMPTAGPGELVIKNVAISALHDLTLCRAHGRYLSQFPFILGEDAAGFVEEVGAGVTGFKKGDRVIAHCHGLMTRNPANSAFQSFPIVTASLASLIPDSMTFEQAVVLPLAVSTACAGLYDKDLLNLPLPSTTKPKSIDKTILIWGGASSVGATAIQLATASGVTVITTASPANYDFFKSLGAGRVFDYRSPTVVEEISCALAETEFVGVYDAIGEESSYDAVSAILDRLNKKVPVASVLPNDKKTERFSPVYVIAFSIIQEPNQHVGERIWGKFISETLKNGSFQAKPDPVVTGRGLGSIQEALDIQRQGVSAKKIVVTL
ncbi:zinc-binding oxidoreductase [Colletotrichum kahawae]|uniref:Zinc-binding oxidoreductase n=1 Tax=Colletotrichum kahawae TaxID=34407 RepID=A0AAD9Y4Z5_COLKA|nr:zinc-binding oxidoreductase [Colletotrichum kahawae]